MRDTNVFSCALAFGLVAQPLAAADEPEFRLQPAEPWRLQAMDDRCRLSRSFGQGEDETLLRLEQGGAEQSYNLTIIGRPVRHPYGIVIRVQFGPDEQASYRGYVPGTSTSGRASIGMSGVLLAPVSAEMATSGKSLALGEARLSAITSLSLARSIVTPFALDLGPMDKPLARLAGCAVQVARKLDMGGLVKSDKSRPPTPIGDPDNWLDSSDYPRDLARMGMEGLLQYRLTIDEAGKPTYCHIEKTDRPQMFDDAICAKLLHRTAFEPARDAIGRPRAAYFRGLVRFNIR